MRRYRSASTNPNQLGFDFGEPNLVRQCGAFREGDTLAAQYYLDDEDIARKFGHVVPSTLADLIDIAVAVHMADRLAPRRCGNSQLAWWRRDLHVTVPVRRLCLWSSVEIQNALLETLRFLTDDDWSIKFSSRLESGRVSETQHFLFAEPFECPINVGLYSGGLDSLAGTAAALGSDSASHFVCVSGVPNHRQGIKQRLQVKRLNSLSSGRVTHVQVPCWLQSANELAQDPSRRTRGFLFLLLGAVTALFARVPRLFVYENGVGAINLPYQRDQIGIPNSRGVHPRTLRLVSNFISLVTRKRFEILNPAVLKTKAEMCGNPYFAKLSDLIAETFSCDGYPVRRRGKPQCGVCTSCLLRRVALENAGVAPFDTTGYLHDVRSETFQSTRQRLQGLSAMDWQVERLLTCFRTSDPWADLRREFPDLHIVQEELAGSSGNLAGQRVRESLMRLFKRHCEEWRAFQPRDWMRSIGKAA